MPLTWILLVLLGLLLGWLTGVILPARTPGQLLALLALGLAGALGGAFVITPPLAGRLALLGFSLPGLLFSLLGSVLALALAFVFLRRLRRGAGPVSGA